MQYNFNEIEAKWQKYWAKNQTFKAENNSEMDKFYVLDMFPYPSGAGLHVGHPLGYIASDIYARYKRHKGFNVMHPQGYDSFGLPAEQYAIQTGQHPAITTAENIKTYRRQLDQIGFSFDWSREVRTSDPKYYKWTQWIFIQLFNSWYNKDSDKAEDIETLIAAFSTDGNANVDAVCDEDISEFSATDWNSFSSKEQQEILLKYRLTYLADTEVNWCPALGTVLANDEIVNGVSERGGHPVIRKKMTQWSMRISAYAQRLLDGLNTIDWPQPLKDSQTNWIGRSQGASVTFNILPLAPSEGGGTDSRLTGDSSIIGTLLERAKEMRQNPTEAETKLWEVLRKKDFIYKFRRQHPIYKYIVDFVCLEKNLIIEVDGKIHEHQLNEDAERQLILEQKKGFKVIRFTNEEVLNNIQAVKEKIREELNSLPSGEGWGGDLSIEVFTTRPDTIFGASFMTLAPEHELVEKITTPEQKAEVDAYIEATAKRSERDRMADVKTISGAFTGAYAEHPFSKKPIPIWIGDYVLAGYGTGAVMSVPCGDQRDYDFAKHFDIPIPNIFEGVDISEEAFADKEKTVIANSDFLNGLPYKKAVKTAIYELEKLGQGKGKINYRLRDAVFSRQRYWGEPFPVYYIDGMPQMIDPEHLPIVLPEVEKYLPTETGEPPLGNATVWAWDTNKNEVVSNDNISPSWGDREGDNGVYPLELNTMPGWAGSSQYFNRYMDPHNDDEIFSKEAIDYWQDVDLYIGGSEHATGHLLYARFWQKFMFDRGYVPKDEFAKKLINQGMITGTSAFVYRAGYQEVSKEEDYSVTVESEINHAKKTFPVLIFSKGLLNDKIELLKTYQKEFDKINTNLNLTTKISSIYPSPIHADVSLVDSSNELDIEGFKNWQPDYKDAKFVLEDGKYIVGREVEKMSKSKYNVVNPDDIVKEYGADSLRLYEMFLGPLEQSKPWNTAGITGVHSFLKKLWKLYFNENGSKITDAEASAENLKTLHKTIKKVEEDIENFSFNTSVSTFMICVNELTAQKCTSKAILEPLAILVSPYAPHIAEELWEKLGHAESISSAAFPTFEPKYLVESSKEYPISFNGKMKFTMELSLDLSEEDIETAVMAHEKTQQQLAGRTPKKVIVVPGKIVNIVG
ncbi:leucine--tRNA ligase [Maribacter sp. 2308TA10-17]|uniref:leucine--tRNA ligase n=1 Tax=Maribacter sp. 2308TA10-17 TaxID=3386276 RepID=UPI0039BC3453